MLRQRAGGEGGERRGPPAGRQHIHLITDEQAYKDVRASVMGGLSCIFQLFAQANNPELGEEDYNPKEPVSWISYLDFNAMYPAAMTLPMPNGPCVAVALPKTTQRLRAWSSAGCRAAKNLRRRSSGTGPGFAHFCTQKASGDKAVTSGDEFSGLEFAAFRDRKRNSEHGKRLEPVFGGKRANLEARAPLSTSDTKKRTFRSWPFSALFAPKTEW